MSVWRLLSKMLVGFFALIWRREVESSVLRGMEASVADAIVLRLALMILLLPFCLTRGRITDLRSFVVVMVWFAVSLLAWNTPVEV